MLHAYKVVVAFSCPFCRNGNTLETVMESTSEDHKAVADHARSFPVTCATCSNVAPPETAIHVHVARIPDDEYARYVNRYA
jgi:predicted GTPase